MIVAEYRPEIAATVAVINASTAMIKLLCIRVKKKNENTEPRKVDSTNIGKF